MSRDHRSGLRFAARAATHSAHSAPSNLTSVLALSLALLALALSAAAAVPTDGLIAHWTFEEEGGALTADVSGNGHTGMLAGAPQWTPGQVGGGALTLDGVDDAVAVAPSGVLNDPGAVTITAWIRHSPTTIGRAIVDKRMGKSDGYSLYVSRDNHAMMRVNGSSVEGTTIVTDEEWHLVAGVYNGSGITVYVDGFAEASLGAGSQSIANPAHLYLGKRGYDNDLFFTGSLDDVRIYDRELSADELLALYEETSVSPPDTAPPVRTNGLPAGRLAAGTFQATLSMTTDEDALCRYDTAAGTAYDAMAETFADTGGRGHTTVIDGLADGASYTFFVRCEDGLGNQNLDDYAVDFWVAEAGEIPPPAGHWSFDEGVGRRISDLSGNGNDGALLNGVGWVPATLATGADFDGVDDHVRLLDLATDSWILDFRTGFSVAVWVNPATLSGARKVVVKDSVYELMLTNGEYFLRLNNYKQGQGSTHLVPGVWQHLAAAWDGQTVRYYYNGEPDGTAPFTGNAAGQLDVNDKDVGIGGRPIDPYSLSPLYLYRGALDELYFWGEGLGDAEVYDVYQQSTPFTDVRPPFRAEASPAQALAIGTTSATLALATNEEATCRYATVAATPYDEMPYAFAVTGATEHSQSLAGLHDGETTVYYVRCSDVSGNHNDDDYAVPVRVLAPTPASFTPKALPGLEFYLESTFFEDPANHARSVATCDTAECLGAGDNAPIEQQYCNRALFPDGCIRRWEDQSVYVPPAFEPPEWIAGRDFGQDDAEKAGLIMDCLNGHPCARGGPDSAPTNSTHQAISLEIEVGQGFSLDGPFSLFHLARPVPQASDYYYYGTNGLRQNVADGSLSHRFGGLVIPVGRPGAVANDVWQLIEVHRDADHNVQVIVNGVDVTDKNPASNRQAKLSDYLSFKKGVHAMYGDAAATAIYNRDLDDQERHDVRSYFQALYSYQ